MHTLQQNKRHEMCTFCGAKQNYYSETFFFFSFFFFKTFLVFFLNKNEIK